MTAVADPTDTLDEEGTTVHPTRVADGPGALPLLGHALPLLRDPLRFFRSLPTHGDLVRIRLGSRHAMVVCKPALVNELLRNDRVFPKGGDIARAGREAAGPTYSLQPAERFRSHRRTIARAFHSSRMPGYAARMSEQIDKALGGWRDGQIIDVSLDMYRIATGVLFATLFDANPPVRVLDQVASDVTTVYDNITKRALMPASLATLTPGNRRYQHARGRLRRLAGEILADRRADGNDLPAMLLAASGEADVESPNEPDRLTEAELVSNMVLFLLAGTGTTANLLIWALHLLAQHPEFQHRLQSEVDTVLAGTPATLADLPNLPLTGQLINEALRLYPTGWIFSRTAATDTHLGGHPIPAGTTLIWSAYVIHHRADLYPDPERFNPERWASPDSNLRAADATYLPFATGPHYCIGQSFALAEAGLALTAVVSRWELKPICGTPVEPRPGQILRANHLKLGVTARRPTLTSAGPSRGPSTGQQCPYHEPPG